MTQAPVDKGRRAIITGAATGAATLAAGGASLAQGAGAAGPVTRGVSVRDLYGGRFIGPEQAVDAMAVLKARSKSEFDKRLKRREAMNEQLRKFRAPFASLVEKDPDARSGISGMRNLARATRDQNRGKPVIMSPNATERIFLGSLGATLVAPFYHTTWIGTSGETSDNTVTAHPSGQMSFDISTGDNGDSSVSAWAAVGIPFHSAVPSGLLNIWSTPAFSYAWADYCQTDGASADGWIGLYVNSFDLAGGDTGAVVDMQWSLWSDSSWWNGTWGEATNSGFALRWPPIPVDQDHQYVIWVWMGGDVSGGGWSNPFWGSGAFDIMNVAVPSISWELFS